MDGLQVSVDKMEREGIPAAAIDTFRHYYEQLAEGETGMLPESQIEPVEDVQQLDDLPAGEPRSAWRRSCRGSATRGPGHDIRPGFYGRV